MIIEIPIRIMALSYTSLPYLIVMNRVNLLQVHERNSFVPLAFKAPIGIMSIEKERSRLVPAYALIAEDVIVAHPPNMILTHPSADYKKGCVFMSDSVYEHFRTILTMNLCHVLPAEQLNAAIQAVDITMDDFEIVKKQMEIITTDGVPEVVKRYIASKYIAHCSTGTLKQYRFHLTHFFDAVRKSYLDVTANDIRLYLYKMKTERNTSDH